MISLPRHKLLRLAALELVRGLLRSLAHVVAECAAEEQRGRLSTLCSRIEQHRERAFRLTAGGEILDLSGDAKASARYQRAIGTLGREITASWPAELDASGFLSAVLAVVAETEAQLPRTPSYLEHRYEWGQVHTLLGQLYELFDPDYLDVTGIEHGSQVGERMVSL